MIIAVLLLELALWTGLSGNSARAYRAVIHFLVFVVIVADVLRGVIVRHTNMTAEKLQFHEDVWVRRCARYVVLPLVLLTLRYVLARVLLGGAFAHVVSVGALCMIVVYITCTDIAEHGLYR